MNRNIFRLVFNSERHAWVPVAENVRGRGKKNSRRRLAGAALGLALAGVGNAQAAPTVPAANAVPVPSSGARPFVFSGSVLGGQPSTAMVGGTNTMTINTPSRTLGLNWDSFNIGSDAAVVFNQPDAASRVLNRIWSADPSVIMGRLTANGEVYLINQNGILFGNGSQVNVGGLVASALNLSDGMLNKLLNSGLPTTRGDRLEFAWDGTAADFNLGFITVDAGARIGTPSGGRVVLLAPKTVENLGLIEGGAGAEAILAAGGKVVLTVPDDPSLRGLLVETQAFAGKDVSGNAVNLDGSATNTGRINTGSGGVVSLAALAVNQKGIVNASRAVNLNGTTMLVSGSIETDRLTINQRGPKAEIDWLSGFNVGAGKTVEFVQPSTGSVVYNYVYDPDRIAADGSILNVAGRSSIDGILRATGQFFLINERGIRFGASADVTAASLVASGLGVSASLVRDGIFAQDVKSPSFSLSKNQLQAGNQSNFDTMSASARAAFAAATVDVASGARIRTTVDNGFVMLVGSKVTQGGTITTPKGQALLAAGADVYLKPPFSAGLRGFMAEVNPLYIVQTWDRNLWGVIDHGSVANTGTIVASLGNIFLSAYDITQAGRLTASTSATANGSIFFVARDLVGSSGQRKVGSDGVAAYVQGESYSANKAIDPDFVVGQNGGTLRFANGSVTEILVDGSSGKTISPDQIFVSSSIEAMAKKIVIEGDAGSQEGASLVAHGGRIRLMASNSFDLTRGFAGDPVVLPLTETPAAGIGVFIGDGARLDVSGVRAQKSVSDLFVEVELRGDEFANNTVQRFSKLRGKKAWVDIRDGVKIADLYGWFGKVGQTVEEKAASGGTISLKTTGSIIVKPNAELDVSGGGVDYEGGTVTESRVLSIGGKSYRLNDAPTSAIYYGIRDRQRKLADYYEGRSAGSLEFVGNSLALDGRLIANTTRGAMQRDIGGSVTDHYSAPLGGKLIIQDAGQHFPVQDRYAATEEEKIRAYSEAQIAFVKGVANASVGLGAGDSVGKRLELSQSLVDAGFSRFDIKSDGRIDIGADIALNLSPGGELSLSGRQIHVAGDISAPGGKIALTTKDMSTAAGLFPTESDAKYSTLVVDDGASLSTAGQWVNDSLDRKVSSRRVKATDGGNISLVSAYDIDLRAGSELNVSGGALVSNKGKLEAGDAGSIALTTGGMGKNGGFDFVRDLDRRDASVFLGGTLAAYALGSGGSLEINTSAVLLGDRFASDSRNWSRSRRLAENQVGVALTGDFFNGSGFYDFKLVGRDGVTVKDGTRIVAQPTSWSLVGLPGYRRKASGSELAGFARSVVLHPELRSSATDLTLATRSLEYGDLVVGDGAYLGVSPNGSINLESWAQLTVLGTLEAPAGNISLSRPAGRSSDPYNFDLITYSAAKHSESIYLGPNSRLLAAGTTVLSGATRRALEAGVSADSLRERRRYKGEVLPGGKVEINAGLGYLITTAGSVIDVSGAQDSLNAAATTSAGGLTYESKTIGSAGGQVSLAAREGMFLDGNYAADGKNGALGGTFSLRFADTEAKSDPWALNEAISLRIPPVPTAEEAALLGGRVLTLYQSNGLHTGQWPTNIDTAAYLSGTATLDPVQFNGKVALDLAPLHSAGFGSWYLTSQDAMHFSGSISATVNNQLRLDAPKFAASSDATRLSMTAAAIQLGSYVPAGAPVTTATIGGAEAKFSARDIGISGNFTWNGFAISQFDSAGEIHFDSTANSAPNRVGGRNFSGQMTATGNIGFAAARLSPSTYSDYRVDLTGDADGIIAITRPAGATAGESLAAGGRLEFAAQDILHSGTVTAPLGEIVFSASAPGGKVKLDETSVTSVAAGQTMMFGQTDQSGRYWQFNSYYWNPGSKSLSSVIYGVERAPEKAIRIDATNSIVSTGAKLDLSAGGEAIAAEFTPGPGGKTNILAISAATTEAAINAGNAVAATVFAVLPGWNGLFAPQDSQAMGYSNVSSPVAIKASDGSVTFRYDSIPTLKPGNQVQLAANGSGLAAGIYTLLPASYALLPGAYLVSVKPASERVVSRSRGMSDGGWLVNGSILAMNADGSRSAYSQSAMTFEVANPTLVDARATYQISRLSDFFYDTAGNRLPGDVGQLSVIGRHSLTFDPSVVAMRQAEIAAADGRKRAGNGLQLDIAADRLFISDGAAAPDASWSVVDQNKVLALGATSLLLGATRFNVGADTEIDTIASQVLVRNSGAGNPAGSLVGPELMLTAKDEVKVAAGSRIESLGKAAGRQVVLDGDGAFLRVAEGDQADISRTGNVTLGTGSLVVEAGAAIAGQSVVFDATKNDGMRNTFLDGSLSLGTLQAGGGRSGGSLTIGAGRINVVGDSSTPSNGLTLNNNDLQGFAQANQLRLTSYTTLDLYGDALLGAAGLNELVIGAAGIAGHGSGLTNIVAKSVVFDNPNPESAVFATDVSLGSGALQVNADRITFGANVKNQTGRDSETTGFAIRGFDTVGLKASGDVRFDGLGVTAIDNVGGSGTAASIVVDAGRVVMVGTADHLLTASGRTEIKGGAAGGSAMGLGGSLEVRAKAIDISGRIETPSGKLTLAATGGDSATDHVTVKEKAVIAAEGSKMAFTDTFAYASGGSVTLKSAKGNVAIDARAIVSVAADTGGGDAGTLSLAAQEGNVSAAAGTLRATASTGDGSLSQGTLKVDAGTVSLDGLAAAVTENMVDGSTRRNFTGQWDIRSRVGDLSLAKSIAAERVTIAADNGGVSVGTTGKIDASGAKGGTIELYARTGDVNLAGQLLAKATEKIDATSNAGTRGQGGTVVLAAEGSGKVITEFASSIDVGAAAGSVASGGKVTFRGAKWGSETTGIWEDAANANIRLAGGIVGARDVSAEIVSSYTGTSLKSGMTSGPAATRALGLTSIQNDLATLYSAANVDALRGNFGFSDTAMTRFHIRPGVDITPPNGSTSDFTISTDLNLSSLRIADASGNTTEAGVLTIRVPKSLRINNTISDGFVSPGASAPNGTERDAMIASGGDSWSYRLIAGADTSAANILTTNALATGSHLQIASGKLVRTGTGSIDLVAAGNITLASRAAVYTAGVDDGSVPANFNQLGAGDDDNQGTKAHFSEHGGDIRVSAGGSVTQSATSLISDWLVRYGSGAGSTQWWSRTASFLQGFGTFGGGDLSISAGANVTGVTAVVPTNGRVPAVDGIAQSDLAVILGGGDLKVSAGGNISGGQFYAESGDFYLAAGKSILSNPTIGLGNTSVRVLARQDANLGNITNPLSSKRDSLSYKDSAGSSMGNGDLVNDEYKVRIGTFNDESSFDLVALNGSAKLNGSADPGLNLAPSKVKVAALNGDIAGSVNQSPGSHGQLDLLAGKSILVSQGIVQYDTPASELPSITNPLEYGSPSPYSLTIPSLAHGKTLWHADDPEPSRLIALDGDISGPGSKDVTARFNEPVRVEASGDINGGLSIVAQHLNSADVSTVQAGGDIRLRDTANASTMFQIDGPGRLEVIAGKSVDLGGGTGIISRGNLENPFLPTGGADIFVMAGASAPDYAAFVQYLQHNGLPVGRDTSPNGLRNRFYRLLRDFGNEAENGGGEPSYEKGRAAISALFPNASVSEGNIDLFYSAIKTEQGGRIDLLAPGGSVTVGIANPSSTITKKPAEQGLFTFRGGDIRAFVRDDFLVNQSRVFTLDGGDILVWADRGNIDAGNGAKTVSATPPPVLVVRDGQIILDASNSVSGSGIGALTSRDTSPISNMYLFAPQGAIDAGDAGLRSSGNITLGAQTILNASNIQAAGSVTGAPAPAVTAAPVVTPTSPANSDKGEAQAASALAGNREAALGILTVEVIEGGEAATEQTAAPASKKDDEKKKR